MQLPSSNVNIIEGVVFTREEATPWLEIVWMVVNGDEREDGFFVATQCGILCQDIYRSKRSHYDKG